MNIPRASLATRWRFGERGQSLVMIPALLTMLLGASALVVDMGNLYFSYQELLSATQAAAKAAGQAMPNPAVTSVESVADLYSGATSSDYNYHAKLAMGTPTVTFDCVNPASYPGLNLPPCATAPNGGYGLCTNGSTGSTIFNPNQGCNVVQVKETATVQTFFAKLFGVTSLNISAAASSSASGGGAIPYHIMMVLDTTKSMGDTTDTGCVSGSSTSYSAEQCAQLGVQTFLNELAPCAANYSNCSGKAAVDDVGLMVFPGLCSDTNSGVTTSNCPAVGSSGLTNTTANSTYAPPDYACPTTNPPIAEYNNNPEYLVLGFQSNYRASDTAALNWSSGLVDAVGAGTDSCGVGTPGGEGTFYAGAIVAAQQYLHSNHSQGIQDIMIILSDGDASSSSTQMGGSVKQTVSSSNIAGMSGNLFSSTAECTQAVNAASWARSQTNTDDSLTTKIYSVSYGSETSGCTSGESVPEIAGNAANTPCATMAGISSSPLSQYFFSVPQTVSGKTSTVCSGAVPITQLSQVFTAIAGDLTSARLIPNVDF